MIYLWGAFRDWGGLRLEKLAAFKKCNRSIFTTLLLVFSVGTFSAEDSHFKFFIPEQPLVEAILKISRQAGVSIVLEENIDASLIVAVSGVMTAEQALNELLSGSGLKVLKTSERSFAILKPREIKSIELEKLARQTERAAAAPSYIEEVLVTSQKREQNLQDVPIAVTALGHKSLELHRIRGVEDIVHKVPGFFISQQGPNDPELTIRGIGSSDRESGSDSSVVTFIDEVYIGRSGGATIDLFDVERIEVLRGPQGTLFGRNAVGGAINITTKKPSLEKGLLARATVGSDNLYELGLVLNNPINSKLLSRMSLSERNRDGLVKDLNTREDTDSIDNLGFRGALKFLPADDLEMLFSAEFMNDNVNGIHVRIPKVSGMFSGIDNLEVPSSFHSVTLPVKGFLDKNVWGLSGRLDWELSNGIIITSLTAYRAIDFHQDRDLSGAYVLGSSCAEPSLGGGDECFLSREIIKEESNLFSQEFRFTSPSDGRINWLLGLYYLYENTRRDQERKRLISIDGEVSSSDPLFDQFNKIESFAVFGELNFHITDKLVLSTGSRWTHDFRTMDLAVIDLDPENIFTNVLNPAQETFSVTGVSKSWQKFTPKINLSYHLFDQGMLYLSWGEGFKAGGYNGLAGSEDATGIAFSPEQATNLEFGFKSQFAGGRIQLNLAVYRMSFNDLQMRRRLLLDANDQTTNTIVIGNVGKAKIEGFEAELKVYPWPEFNLAATYSHVDSEVIDPEIKVAFEGVFDDGLIPQKGDPLPRAPRNSVMVALDYRVHLQKGDLGMQLDYAWIDDVYFDFNTPSPHGFQGSYELYNGSIRYVPDNSAWKFTLWAKNLANKEYWIHQQPFSGGISAVGRVGDPRTFGLSVAWEIDL